jgi:hypothetical protein
VSPRELGDERKRYGTKSIGERLDDILGWPAEHRVATTVLIAFVLVGLLLSFARGLRVDPESLAVGDCLFVRTTIEPTADRPIGEDGAVAAAVLAGQVERASCAASHGHEISDLVDLRSLADPVVAPQVRCEAAFEAYVGRARSGSIYETFAAAPDAAAQAAGANRAFCLIARIDGQWMDHPARGSRE